MKQYYLRVIVKSNRQIVHGITVPSHLAEKFSGVCFYVKETPTGIIFESGCPIAEFREQRPNILYW
jgi:hypothetical protein